MPDPKNNREERQARLELLMEEYRVKTDATRETIDRIRQETRSRAKAVKANLEKARARKREGK